MQSWKPSTQGASRLIDDASVSPDLCAFERYQIARRIRLVEDRTRRLAGEHNKQSGAEHTRRASQDLHRRQTWQGRGVREMIKSHVEGGSRKAADNGEPAERAEEPGERAAGAIVVAGCYRTPPLRPRGSVCMRRTVHVPDLGLCGADAAQTVASFGRFSRKGIVLGQMTVELSSKIKSTLDLGAMARFQQL
jgi:hypothetical protein